MSSIEEQLREYFKENVVMGDTEDELGYTDSFLNSGLIDSMGILELVDFLEGTYAIEISDGEMLPEHLDSISNVVAFVTRKKA